MARKIKFHSLHILFRLFAFLADKTGGWHLFVKPKMLLGSLLLGIGLTGCGAKTESKTEEKHQAQRMEDTICSNEVKDTTTTKNVSLKQVLKHRTKNKKTQEPTPTAIVSEEIGSSCYMADVKVDTVYEYVNVYDNVDEMPQFPGGNEALAAYIEQEIRYPEFCLKYGIQGTVECRFAVTNKGGVTWIKVTKPATSSLDKEAVRIIRSLPKFIPGKQKGENVYVWKTVTVTFKLPPEENTSLVKTATSQLDTTTKTGGKPIYLWVEQMPQFPGTPYKLSSLIDEHLKYPREAKEKGIQGAVICRFLVTKTGKIKKVHVIESLDRDCDREAIRVVKRLPKFIPGQHKGEKVNVWHTLPIEFKLPENK